MKKLPPICLNRLAKEFGLEFVEGKQKIQGSATTWEIDAKGVAGDEGFFIVECRRHTTSKQSQRFGCPGLLDN
jgi:hypothetical protein